MSYVRFDDQHEDGRLTDFCQHLSGEVRVQTGSEFRIFQDRKDIAWGQQWRERIDESLDGATFLIPILTPSFFISEVCRSELKRFLDHEKQLRRNDLILPVYYVNCAVLNEAAKRDTDPLAGIISARQSSDWRELRFELLTSGQVRRALAKMAIQIAEALGRSELDRPAIPARRHEATFKDSARTAQAENPERTEASSAEPTEAPVRPTQKTEPLTSVVYAFNRGDYVTLTDALQAAKPGDRILLRPGLYQEGIVIDKPIEIIGEGEMEEVVIEAKEKMPCYFGRIWAESQT